MGSYQDELERQRKLQENIAKFDARMSKYTKAQLESGRAFTGMQDSPNSVMATYAKVDAGQSKTEEKMNKLLERGDIKKQKLGGQDFMVGPKSAFAPFNAQDGDNLGSMRLGNNYDAPEITHGDRGIADNQKNRQQLEYINSLRTQRGQNPIGLQQLGEEGKKASAYKSMLEGKGQEGNIDPNVAMRITGYDDNGRPLVQQVNPVTGEDIGQTLENNPEFNTRFNKTAAGEAKLEADMNAQEERMQESMAYRMGLDDGGEGYIGGAVNTVAAGFSAGANMLHTGAETVKDMKDLGIDVAYGTNNISEKDKKTFEAWQAQQEEAKGLQKVLETTKPDSVAYGAIQKRLQQISTPNKDMQELMNRSTSAKTDALKGDEWLTGKAMTARENMTKEEYTKEGYDKYLAYEPDIRQIKTKADYQLALANDTLDANTSTFDASIKPYKNNNFNAYEALRAKDVVNKVADPALAAFKDRIDSNVDTRGFNAGVAKATEEVAKGNYFAAAKAIATNPAVLSKTIVDSTAEMAMLMKTGVGGVVSFVNNKHHEATAAFEKTHGRKMTDEENATSWGISLASTGVARGGLESIFGSVNFGKLAGKAFDASFKKLPTKTQEVIGKYSSKFNISKQEATEKLVEATKFVEANNLVKAPKGAFSTKVGNTKISTVASKSQVKATGDIVPGKKIADSLKPKPKDTPKPADVTKVGNKNASATVDQRIIDAAKKDDKLTIRKVLDTSWKGTKATGKGVLRGSKAIAGTKAVTALTGEAVSEASEEILDTYAATGGDKDTKIDNNKVILSGIMGGVLGVTMHGMHAPIQAHRTAKIDKKIGEAKQNMKDYFKYADMKSPEYNPLKAAEMLASDNMPATFAAAEGGDSQKGMANWHQAAATAKQGINTAMAQKMSKLSKSGATKKEILTVHGVYQEAINKLETYKESLIASDVAAIKESISTKDIDKAAVDHLADTVAVYGADYFTDEELQRTLSNPGVNDSQKAMLRAAIAFNGARASFAAEHQGDSIKLHHAGNDGVAIAPDGTLTVSGALDQFKESGYQNVSVFDGTISRLRNEGGNETEIRMWTKAKEMAVLSGSYVDARTQEIAQSQAVDTPSDGSKAPKVPTANAANAKMRKIMQEHKVGKVAGSKGEIVVTRKQGKKQKFFLNSDAEAQAKLYENKKWKNNPELKDVEFESFEEYLEYHAREVAAMNAEGLTKSLKEIQDNNVSRTQQILNSMGKTGQGSSSNGSTAVADAVSKAAKFDHIPNETNKAGNFKVNTDTPNSAKKRNLEKDKAKFNNENAPINKLIAFGLPGTSTSVHARENASMIEETNFFPEDIVGISINGISRKNGKPQEVVDAYDANTKRTMKALRKAVEAKSTIVTDNLADRSRNHNNKTEGTIAKILQHQGYVEIDNSGVWVHGDHIKSKAESTDTATDTRTEAKNAWSKVKDALKNVKVKRNKNTMSTRETRGLTASPTPNTTYKAKDIKLPEVPELANKTVNAVRYDYLMEMLHRIRKMKDTAPALKRIIKSLEYNDKLTPSVRMSLFSQAVSLAGIGSLNTTTKMISRTNKQRLDLIANISELKLDTKKIPKSLQKLLKQVRKQKYAVAFTNDKLTEIFDAAKLYPSNESVAENSKLAYQQLLANTIDISEVNAVAETDPKYNMAKLLKSANKLFRQKSNEAKSIIGMEANLPSKWAQPVHRESLIFQYKLDPHQISLMDVLMAEYENFAKNYEATSGAADATNYKFLSNYMQDMSMLFASKYDQATPENVMFAGQIAFREYVLRNAQSLTMPTERDAKAFFGRKNEDTIDAGALELMQNAGLPINIVAPNIGRSVIKHLNLAFDSSIDDSFQKNIEHALGMHVLAAMKKAGELDFNEISADEIGTYHLLGVRAVQHEANNHVTFVKLKHKIEQRRGRDTIVQSDYANNNSALFQQYKSALSLFDISKPRNHSFKPIKATSKYVEGSVMHVDNAHKRVQESLQSVKFVANDIAFQLATKLGIDTMMDVQGYTNDLDSLHIEERPGATGKNRNIENTVREAFAFLNEELRDDKGKLDLRKGFYLQTKIISSTRIQEVSNSIKIQGSSLHRQLYGAEAWDTNVHMDDVQVMQAVSEILEEQIGMSLDEAMENIEIQEITDITEKDELTDADKAKLVEFAKEHEKFASLQALHIVSNYRKALKNRRKKFRVFMPHETDGVSNGVISAKLQLPPGYDVMGEEYTEFMARGGVFVNNAYTTVGDFLSTLDERGNKHVDNYMNIMRYTATIIDDKKQTTANNGGVGAPKTKDSEVIASQAQWDFVDAVVAPIIENGEITRAARKVGKLPLMTTVYGSGKKAVFEAQFADLKDSLYADLGKEDSKYLGALSTILGSNHSFMGSNGQPLSVEQRREKRFTPTELEAIKSALEATHGDALGSAIDIVLFDFMESRNVMNAMGKFVNTVFVTQFEDAYIARATDLGKVNLTQADINALLKEFRDAGKLPTYLLSLSDSDISGVMISGEQNTAIAPESGGIVQVKFGTPIPKNRISRSNGRIVITPARATKSLSGTLTKREYGFDTGVKPFQVLNISVDSAVNTLTALGENVANVHDATLQSVLETAGLGGKANLAYLTVHRDWSMVESMDRAVQKSYAIYSNLSEENQYRVSNILADDRQSKTGEQLPVVDYNGMSGVEPGELVAIWNVFATEKKAARAEFFNEITGVGQFDTLYGTLRNSEDPQEIPPKVKTYAKDLKEDLEKVATSDGNTLSYKTRLGLVPSMTPEQSATVLSHNLVDAENGEDSTKSKANVEHDIAPIPENFKDSPFKAVTGDVLNAPADSAVVITTNGNVTNKGKLTMGKGLALQAKRRYPGIEDKLGAIVKENGNVPHLVRMEEKIDTIIDLSAESKVTRKVVSLPTKPSKFVFDGSNAMDQYASKMKEGNSYVGWKAKTNLNTLKASLNHLVTLANKEGLEKIAITLPGYGEGGLKLKEIKPLLDEILDDRFTLYLLPYAIDEDVEPTTIDGTTTSTDHKTTTHQSTYDYQHTPENERYLVVNNQFEANPDQKKLIDKLTEFLMTDGVTKFILQGRGGTGKTSSLARGLMNYASEHNGHPPRDVIHLSTISHQAKNVLDDASTELDKTRGLDPNVSVLASLLYTSPKGKPLGKHKELLNTASSTIVVVDEISMVDEATLSKLNRYVQMGGKVIFMGDYHQIMAVDPNAPSRLSSVFTEFNNVEAVGGRDGSTYTYELRQIMRQKEGSGILDLANYFADVIDVRLGKILPENATKLPDSFENAKASDDTAVIDEATAIRRYVKLLKEGNNDLIFTTYKNKDVHLLNTKIREKLYGNDGVEYHVGEHLIAYGNQNEEWASANNTHRITNSSKYTVAAIEDYTVIPGTPEETLGLAEVAVRNGVMVPKWKPGTKLVKLTLKGKGNTPDNAIVVPAGLMTDSIDSFIKNQDDKKIAAEYLRNAVIKNVEMHFRSKENPSETVKHNNGIFNVNSKNTEGTATYIVINQMFPSLQATMMYGYASTVHKAQGSGFHTAFTTLEPIKQLPGDLVVPKDNNTHINYTAITRAKRNLYIVTDNAKMLSRWGQPDKKLLGSTSDDFDINELDQIADVEVTPRTISETFDNLTTLGGKKDSPAHEQRLRELLNSIVSPFLNTYSMVQKIKQVKKGMATGASAVGISRATIYAKVTTTSKPGLTSGMSNAEVYTHELIHPIIRKGFENNPDLRIEAQKMLDTLRRRYDENKLIDMLMPETYTGTEAEERANVKARYEYLFNNDRTGLEEFVVHGLSNETLINALGNEKFDTELGTKPKGFWNKLADIFSRLISRLAGHGRPRSKSTTMAKALNEIAFAAVVSQQSAVAGIKTNKSNFLNRYNNAAVRNFRKWVSSPIQRELRRGLNNVPAGRNYPHTGKGKYVLPLAILAQKDTTYWNNEVASKSISEMIDHIGISREFFGRQIIAEITGMNHLAKSWRGMLRRFKHSLDGAAMDIANGYASDMKKSFSKDTTDAEWNSLTHMLRTDPNALLNARMRRSTMEKMYGPNAKRRQHEIGKIINKLKQSDPDGYNYLVAQAKSLGNFLATGDYLYHWGMPNATAIATFHALDAADVTRLTANQKGSLKNRIKLVDALATLVAIETMPSSHRAAIHRVMKRENARKRGNGISALLDAQQLFVKESKEKLFNSKDSKKHTVELLMTKGYIKEKYSENKAIKIGDLSPETKKKMAEEGFFPVLGSAGKPTPLDTAGHNITDAYIYATKINGMARYLSGTVSLTNEVAKGTLLEDRYIETYGNDVDTIMNDRKMADATERSFLAKLIDGTANLTADEKYVVPILRESHQVGKFTPAYQYRFMMNHKSREQLLLDENPAYNVIGGMFGSIVTKVAAKKNNHDAIHQLYKDFGDMYIDNPKAFAKIHINSKNPRYKEYWKMLPEDTKKLARQYWKRDVIYIHKSLVPLVLGYRKKEFTEWLDNGLKTLSNGVITLSQIKMGGDDKNMKQLMKHSGILWEGIVKRFKSNVVVKMPSTFGANYLSNIVVSWMNGMSLPYTIQKQAEGLKNLIQYQEDKARMQKLERYLARQPNHPNKLKIKRDIAKYKNAMETNAFHVLIQEGMVSTIMDDVEDTDNPLLKSIKAVAPKFHDTFITKGANRIPKQLRDAYNVAVMNDGTKVADLAYKATQYSDAVARYAEYYYFREEDGQSHAEALNNIAEDFITYDDNTNPLLQWTNDVGLFMFTKFFLRSQRVIWKQLKNKPINVLAFKMLDSMVGIPDIFDSNMLGYDLTNRINGPGDILEDAFSINMLKYLDIVIPDF